MDNERVQNLKPLTEFGSETLVSKTVATPSALNHTVPTTQRTVLASIRKCQPDRKIGACYLLALDVIHRAGYNRGSLIPKKCG
ncbi:MAG: hypothetical protein ACLFWL_11055 [Candidatus Brocadiia bacterium]